MNIEIRPIHQSAEQPQYFPVLHSAKVAPWRLKTDTGHTIEDDFDVLLREAKRAMAQRKGMLVVFDAEGRVTQAWEYVEACEIERGAARGKFIGRPMDPGDVAAGGEGL